MRAIIPMIKKEIQEIYRSKKLLILIILFGFIAISSPVVAKLLPEIFKSIEVTPGIAITLPDPTWRDAIDQLIKNSAQIGMIVIIIMFAGSIADEKNKKTLELVLSKPVSRSGFIFSKFCASFLVTKIVFILSMAVFYLYTVMILGTFSLVNFALLALFLLIFILFILSITLFFSVIAKTQVMAIGLAFLTEIVFVTVFGYVEKVKDYSPSYVLNNYKDLMAKGNFSDFLPSAIVSLIVIILLFLFSLYFFRRQEIER